MGVFNGSAKIAKEKQEKSSPQEWDIRVSPHYGSLTFSKDTKELMPEVGFYSIDKDESEAFGLRAGTVLICLENTDGDFDAIKMAKRKTQNGVNDEVIADALAEVYNEKRYSQGIVYSRDENGLCIDKELYQTVNRQNNFYLRLREGISFELDSPKGKVELSGYPLEFVADAGFPTDRFQTQTRTAKVLEGELIETT